jgi:hypothetical protein
MLINLSNHPVGGVWDDAKGCFLNAWSKDQLAAAECEFIEVVDIPFPYIPEEYTFEQVEELSRHYFDECSKMLSTSADPNNAVFLVGELVFCSILSQMLLSAGVRVVCATTKRINEDLGGGEFRKGFQFVRFRDYGRPIVVR